MVCCVSEDESVKKLNSISLSNNTVQRRIEEILVDILQQVISDICRSESGFAIQLDESTDVTNCAQLLIFVRYVGKEGVKEEFLINAVSTDEGNDSSNPAQSGIRRFKIVLDQQRSTKFNDV